MNENIIRKIKELQHFLRIAGEIEFSQMLFKFSQLLEHAASWEEYSAQGPAHKAIEDWWKVNFQKVPGNYTNSYDGWTDWYMDHLHSDWQGMHRSPEEVVELMKAETNPSYTSPVQPQKKKKLFGKNNIHYERGNTLSGTDLIPPESRNFGGGYGRKLSPIHNGQVHTYVGVNLERITPALREFISVLGNTAALLGAETPIITSGWRSFEKQASIMANNWLRNGGMNGGLEYLIKIYGRSYAKAMHQIFSTYGTGKAAMPHAIAEVKKHPGSHVAEVGSAIDLNPTRGIKVVLDTIRKSKQFNLKVVDETDTAGPHYHVKVRN